MIFRSAKEGIAYGCRLTAAAAGGWLEGFVNGMAGVPNRGPMGHAMRADWLSQQGQRSRTSIGKHFWEGRAAFHVASAMRPDETEE